MGGGGGISNINLVINKIYRKIIKKHLLKLCLFVNLYYHNYVVIINFGWAFSERKTLLQKPLKMDSNQQYVSAVAPALLAAVTHLHPF